MQVNFKAKTNRNPNGLFFIAKKLVKTQAGQMSEKKKMGRSYVTAHTLSNIPPGSTFPNTDLKSRFCVSHKSSDDPYYCSRRL